MRYMRPNLCSLLLAFLLVFACDLQAQDDSLRWIWSEQPTNHNYAQLRVTNGISEDGWLISACSGKTVQLIETNSFSTIASLTLEEYPVAAQYRGRDTSIVIL